MAIIYFLFLLLVYVIMNVVIASSVKFQYVFNQDGYFLRQDSYVQIYPQGIIVPEIRAITYSNQNIPINYVKDEKFLRSPVYLKINSSMMTSRPYNSYLTVNYTIPYNLGFIKILQKSEFVPVFDYKTPKS